MHACAGLGGFTAPMVPVSSLGARPDARHKIQMREDYCGQKGMSPVMSIRTDHGDGRNDCTVFAPTASIKVDTHPAVRRFSAPPGGHLVATPWTASVSGTARHHRFRNPDLRDMAEIARWSDSYMAWSASAVFAYATLQALENNIKPSADSYKVALYASNSMTPDKTVTTAALTEYNGAASQWVTANEVSSTNYSAGGTAVTPITVTQSTNVITFTSSGSPQWTTVSFTTYGCLVYDTTVSNEGFTYNYFGGAQEVTLGTFSIAWNASGIATFTS